MNIILGYTKQLCIFEPCTLKYITLEINHFEA